MAPWRPVSLLLLAACAHGATAPTAVPAAVTATPGAPPGPSQYVVADPSNRSSVAPLPLGTAGALGLVEDRTRIVIGRGEPHVAEELTPEAIAGAVTIPARLGSGFLFWTDTAVYRSDAFDGALKPIARMPDSIHDVSFGPKFVLVRTANGERWSLGLPSGDRVALDPLGAADVESLDDGRALAFNDQGAALFSTDGGGHWTDFTVQLKSSPERVAVVDDELWLFESGGEAMRLEPNGQLSSFDKQPEEKPLQMRARDPRWRGAESPLRSVLHGGATIDDSTAIVIEQGDVVRVDVHTGELLGIVAGKLPPDAQCQAVPTGNDVLFACISRSGGAAGASASPSAFVVSHTLSGDAPVIEQTFATIASFFASDDGGLAFDAPCNGLPSSVDHGACVRQPGGSWQDYDVSALASDAGGNGATVSRWVPRADGRAVAFISDPTPGIYDPRSGAMIPLTPRDRDVLAQGLAGPTGMFVRVRSHASAARNDSIVDWSWSYSSSGSLRGWQRQGSMVDIADDGRVTHSPYSFELIASGPFAFGRSQDGRFYQSIDHGGTWTEVAGPPSGASAGDLRGCSSAGCDLGGFYRIGWAVRPARIETMTTAARPAPDVRREPPLELACHPAGAVQSRMLRRTASYPDDTGLGAQTRLPVASDSGSSDVGFVRNTLPRGIVSPLHEPPGNDPETPALRAMLTGYGTTKEKETIEVTGPNKNARALRRGFAFVPAFDPAAPVKKTTFAMADVLTAGHLAGMTTEEILSDDMTETGAVVEVTSRDPGAANDLVFTNPRGLVVLVHPNERVRMVVRPSQNEATILSGVALAGDDAAFLEVEATGVEHVFRTGPGGVSELFDVNPNATDASFYPANPDALAIGPRGDLAVIRLGSGSDPASQKDPPLLLVPSQPAVALAAWSTLRMADDPVCKDAGWRATLQLVAPWVRINAPELRVDDHAMLARVKWTDHHVCLEGLEMKLPDVSLRVPATTDLMADGSKTSSWLVSRGTTYARVSVADGVEWRQPLECTLVPRP